MQYKIATQLSEFRENPEVDNPEPSSLNSVKVDEKVQRLTVEELTNNTDTSAEQPKYWLNFEEWKALKNWYKK